MKQKARLEEWFVGPNDMLYGKVFGHPSLPDGGEVGTTRMVVYDKNTNTATTKNTEYTLGKHISEVKQ